MKTNEIKEIVNYFIKYANIEDSIKISKLEDYITNLQQRIEGLEAENETLRSDFKNQVEYTNKIAEENERLKCITYNPEETNNRWVEEESELRKVYRERDNYKSRCEKAIEYLDNKLKLLPHYMYEKEMYDLLNILQNGSENNEYE